ncbi:thioesterase family protein-like protein [Viridothelium virens]|uniref:Thioesterase family protein-like protein n=1 Tax=Viridothelium virens TaxID=1048519 RepID=A0A6A6HKJ0_VIRVR|nr:thioesterase family protein-like protein [Viridothelium virens]
MSEARETRRKALLAVQFSIEAAETYYRSKPEADKHFDWAFLENLRLVDADPTGMAEFEFEVLEQYCNLADNLHGGAAALMFDVCTSLAISPLAKPGFWEFGDHVSRTINVSYLRPAPSGTTVKLRCQVAAIGKQMCLIRAELKSQDGKRIYCTMEHHKVRTPKSKEATQALDFMKDEWNKSAEKRVKALL